MFSGTPTDTQCAEDGTERTVEEPLDFLTAAALVFAVTFLPLLVGSAIGILLEGLVSKSSLAAAGLGILVWLFIDLMTDANLLGVGRGFAGGWTSLALFAGFLATVAFLVLADKGMGRDGVFPYSAVLLAGLAMALHSAGEAIEIGGAFATAGTGALVGPSAAAFIAHKALEGVVIASFLVAWASRPDWRHVTIPSLLVGGVALAASALGYFSTVPSTIFFALGAGGAVYMMVRLIPVAIDSKGRLRFVVALCVGFSLIYLAALLHAG
jgi:hypothetical protein